MTVIPETRADRLRLTRVEEPEGGHGAAKDGHDPAEVAHDLAEVAHDLRDPIHTMRLAADLLTRSDVDAGQRERLVTAVLRSAEMALSMITSLVNGAEESLELRTVDVRELLEHTRDRFRLQAEQRNVTIEVHVPRGDRLFARADRPLLDRVLSNLIRNALVHADGRRITLSAVPESDGMLRLAVRDTGHGIRPEERQRAYGPSGREGQEREERHGGYGLGIVRRSVEAHGGRLWLDSRPGEGTTFYFTIPAS